MQNCRGKLILKVFPNVLRRTCSQAIQERKMSYEVSFLVASCEIYVPSIVFCRLKVKSLLKQKAE